MSESTYQRSSAGFRKHLPDLNTPRFQVAAQQSADEYAEAFQTKHQPPWLYDLTQTWQKLLEEPYHGITTDGKVRSGLFHPRDEGVPIQEIVNSAEAILSQLTPPQRSVLVHPLNSRNWRAWSNPEILLRNYGLRLESVPASVSTCILNLLESSFSAPGYAKAVAAMRINGFLGEVCKLPRIMNALSYNFLLFGTPSTKAAEPWGFSLYGHHLCLSVFLKGTQIVLSPTFTGAEPNVIDEGPFHGTQILHEEGDLGLKLMQSFPDHVKHRARVYEKLNDPEMRITGDLATDRWNIDDQRHVCGAFRDNRIVPCEGIRVGAENAAFGTQQVRLLLDIVEQFVIYLPDTARRRRLELVKEHLGDTWFCWIGGWGDGDAFYYRIQSPVVLVEFDHHSGVFLANKEPAKFHTHTICRTPNGGDYGNALREKEEEKVL